MPRDRANIRIDLWADDDWRNLTVNAQALYQKLLTHPTLSYCGVADWRPGRLAKLTRGMTAADVLAGATELQSAAFVYVDEDTEEVFIRSFIRHDGVLRHAKLPISMANDFAAVASQDIRRFFVWELRKQTREQADLALWKLDRIKTILKSDAADMKEHVRVARESEAQSEAHSKGHSEPQSMEIPYGSVNRLPSESMPTATATATSPVGDGVVTSRNYVAERERPQTQRDLLGAAARLVNGFCEKLPDVTFPSKIRQDLTSHVTVNLQDGIPAERISRGLELWNAGGYPASTLPGYILQAQREANGQPAPGLPKPRRATGSERAMQAIAIAEQMQADGALGALTDGD